MWTCADKRMRDGSGSPRVADGCGQRRDGLQQLPAVQVCITFCCVKGRAPRRGRGRVRITRGLCAGGAPHEIARSAFRSSPARSGRSPRSAPDPGASASHARAGRPTRRRLGRGLRRDGLRFALAVGGRGIRPSAQRTPNYQYASRSRRLAREQLLCCYSASSLAAKRKSAGASGCVRWAGCVLVCTAFSRAIETCV